MDVIVFEDVSTDVVLNIDLTFSRLVEKGVIDRHNAEIFCNMSISPEIDSDIIEVVIQYVLRYVLPIPGDGLYVTISEFMAPYGISDGVSIGGFLGTPMKPRTSMSPHNRPICNYVAYTNTTYPIAATHALSAFFRSRIPNIEYYLAYDVPPINHTNVMAIHSKHTPVITASFAKRQRGIGAFDEISAADDDVIAHVRQLRVDNLLYEVRRIQYTMLSAYAEKKYNKTWANLDEPLRKIVLFEFAQKEEHLRKQRENQCGHKKVLQQLISLMYNNKRHDLIAKHYQVMIEYYAARKSNTDTIECSNCGFDIMCPHFDMFCRTRSASMVAKAYADPAGSAFYCRLCGELLLYSVELLESIDMLDKAAYTHADELSKQMYKTCSTLLHPGALFCSPLLRAPLAIQ